MKVLYRLDYSIQKGLYTCERHMEDKDENAPWVCAAAIGSCWQSHCNNRRYKLLCPINGFIAPSKDVCNCYNCNRTNLCIVNWRREDYDSKVTKRKSRYRISKYICMLAKLNMLCLTIKCSHTLVTIQLIHNMHAPI